MSTDLSEDIVNVTTVKKNDPVKASKDLRPDAPAHVLDGPEARKLHSKLMGWYEAERERQSENRMQMAIDEDYYDSIQWDPEDARVLMERGQAPLVMNKIKPTIDWIIGTEKRNRIDFKILPREEGDVKGAEIKTKVLKYVRDVNNCAFHRSRAFADACKVGIGWMEDGITTEPGEELLYSGYESWRNMLHDSFGNTYDSKDWRYVFRGKYIDTDIAKAYFHGRADVIELESVDGYTHIDDEDENWFMGVNLAGAEVPQTHSRRAVLNSSGNLNNSRDRVKLIECWYRVPEIRQIMRGEVFDGVEFDRNNPEHQKAVKQEAVSMHAAVKMSIRVAVMTKTHMIMDMPSPYKHNRFPFTPVIAYRRGRDGSFYGPIRPLRDPQDDFNKRHSKALFILSSTVIVADHDAMDYGDGTDGSGGDWDELREEVSQPNAMIIKKKNSELKLERDNALAAQHIDLMSLDAQMIQDTAGVTDDNLGKRTNLTSGIALERRQEQGSVLTTELYDNLRFASDVQGKIQTSLIEQFYSEKKVMRVVGKHGKGFEWLKVNDVDPDTGEIINDITAYQADFIIDQQDYHQSMRQAMFEQSGEMLDKIARFNPQAALALLDVWVELGDIPNRDEFVDRIRKINGQRDPDEELTPDQQQELEAKRHEEAAAKQLQMEMAMAELGEKQAKALKLNAEAEKIRSEIGAGNGDDESMANLARIEEEKDSLIADMQNQINQLTLQLKDKGDEISANRFKTILDNQTKLKIADKNAQAKATIQSRPGNPKPKTKK
jgi:hypothetical protein